MTNELKESDISQNQKLSFYLKNPSIKLITIKSSGQCCLPQLYHNITI